MDSPRAAIYCRISADPKGLSAGVRRQEEDCRALAERKGWEVADVYVDNDISAWNGKARPSYRRMLEDIEAGIIDAVVVWDLDRLHRRPLELEEFFGICDRAGLKHMASVAGDVNLATDDGRFHARILGAVAKKASDDTSRRLKRKMDELAREGKPSGGRRAFGYEAGGITVRRSEAKRIKEAAERVLAGEGLRGIAQDWNRRGVPTAENGRWGNAQLKRILLSARVAGLRAHRGEIVGNAVWPAILDPALRERLTSILTDPHRGKRVSARSYLLAGFSYCALCDSTLTANPSRGKRRYVCSVTFGGCGKILVTAEQFEALVAEAVLIALDTPALRDAMRAAAGEDEEQRELLESIRSDEAALEQLARDHYAERVISRAEFLAARAALETRIGRARKRVESRSRESVLARLPDGPDALRQAWETRGLDWRRSLIGAVVERVIVKPSERATNTFNPERVDIRWRV